MLFRYEIKDMHIFRSALSCCVISQLPYDVIKKYCVPRDVLIETEARENASSSINVEDNILSERSGITTDDEVEDNEADLAAGNDENLVDVDE